MKQARPVRFLCILLGTILLAELVIMVLILPSLKHMDKFAEGVVDALLISTLSSPMLYFFLFRPLRAQLALQAQIEQTLTDTNRELVAVIADLERNKWENTLLQEMDDLLQRSRTFEEAFGIIRKACLKFFPGTTGLLLLLSNSRNMSELVLSWGEGRTGCNPEQCTIENCWALRRGQIHVVGNLGLGHSCAGGEIAETDNYACAPLVAQGLALGVLSLRQEGRSFEQKDQEWVVTVSRHIAPALANLQLNRTLHMQSVRDPLTGLYNRRYLQETLERELHRAKRKNTPIGVIMLDIDHFKRFNDDYGHEAGDAVLQEVSGLLQKWTRVEDIACRFGGEEFVVVMPEAGLETCGKRAEILREQIERLKIAYRGELLRTITSSLGVAVYPDNGATMEDVLTAADAALYRSKASGRNRVSLCDRAPA